MLQYIKACAFIGIYALGLNLNLVMYDARTLVIEALRVYAHYFFWCVIYCICFSSGGWFANFNLLVI